MTTLRGKTVPPLLEGSLGGGGGGGGEIILPNGVAVAAGPGVSLENGGANLTIPPPGVQVGDMLVVYGDTNYALGDAGGANPSYTVQLDGGTSPMNAYARIADGTANDAAVLLGSIQRIAIGQMIRLRGNFGTLTSWQASQNILASSSDMSFNQLLVFGSNRIILVFGSREVVGAVIQNTPTSSTQYTFVGAHAAVGDNGGGGTQSHMIFSGVAFSVGGADIPAGSWSGIDTLVALAANERACNSPNT